MKLFFLVLSVCFTICFTTISLAQRNLELTIFNQATAIPFTQFVTTPIHLGVQAGTEFTYGKRPLTSSRWFQTINASYYYHKHLSQGIALFSNLGYEKRFSFGLSLQGMLGIGYLHTFTTQDEFILSNGTYQLEKDKGNWRIYPNLSIDVGYYLSPKTRQSSRIFVRYQAWAEYPYSPDFIPIMTHINFHIGYKFFL